MDMSLGDVYVPTLDNRFVNQDMMNMAEIIRDYDPALSIRWIPPDKRVEHDLDSDKPYMIIETRNGKDYPITQLTEVQVKNTEWMIASLFMWDAEKHGNLLSDMDARNQARKAIELKKSMEEHEDKMDFMETVIKSPLHTYRHGGRRWDAPGAPVEVRTKTISN